MSILEQIKPFIQAYVLAVASLVEIDTTVVDNKLNRIAGAGSLYTQMSGTGIPHDSFFEWILQTGNPGLVEDVQNDERCKSCEHKDHCRTKTVLGYPIYYMGQVIGIVGFSAMTQTQRDFLISKHASLLEFAKYMSILIENRIQSLEYTNQLESQLWDIAQQNVPTGIVAESPEIKKVLQLARKVASYDSTVLITGESGTGKEEIAKYLHSRSPRKNKPMVSINCAAIPESLVESELFGYEGGSFTGAKKGGAIGKFELANGGTLFLDEIAELPLPTQAKLLRVLQERQIERIGGNQPIPIDVRIICATNRDLRQMCDEHLFREDLYFRINVIPMHLPALRERVEDIEPLSLFFLKHFCATMRKTIHGFDFQAMHALKSYEWPGNIRELKNLIEYLVNMVENATISLSDIPKHISRHPGNTSLTITQNPTMTLRDIINAYEKDFLSECLGKCKTTEEKEQLAKQLGISLATLYRKAATLNLH